jgi:3'-5' exoribonuclease
VRRLRDGSSRIDLGDRSGSLTALVDDAAGLGDVVRTATPVRVRGLVRRPAGRPAELAVRALDPAEPGSFSFADLLDGPARSAELMEQDARGLIATIQRAPLRALLERLLGEGTETWERYRVAPAAKRFHQAYRHGLLEHSVSVAQAVSAISATFPGIDRDVAVTGALLHDIGKLEAYSADPLAIDLTDDGRLQGEIALGYYTVRRAIEAIDDFPADLAQAVLHIILSHHGRLEHGSPVVPATREATLVHFVDNLGGRLGSFDRIEKELPDGAAWAPFDRGIGGGAWFGARPHDGLRRAA